MIRDVVTAIVITVIEVIATYSEAHPSQRIRGLIAPPYHLPHTPTATLLLIVAAGLVLAWRRRYPRAVVAACTAFVVAYTIPGYVNGAALLMPVLALGTLAVSVPLRRAVAWTVAVTAVLMAATASNDPTGWFSGGFFLIPAMNAVALSVGIAISARHAYVGSIRRQATNSAAQEAQRRVEEERLRIARELHDVVAHTMATITVQAAAAAQLVHDRPDEAAESLRAIRAAGKKGLRELRAILNVLRAVDGPDDPTQPVPGLGGLDTLAAGVRAAGLPVAVTVTGRPRDLPTVADLSAFRIIQEALTNTLRHAGPATAAVTVDYGQDELRVEITDTGRGLTDSAAEAAFAAFAIETGFALAAPTAVRQYPGAASPGHGLRGMRERATAAGATIDIGPFPGGGFRVAAILPLGTGSASGSGPAGKDRKATKEPTR